MAEFKFDDKQLVIIELLQKFAAQIKNNSFTGSFTRLFTNNFSKKGIYLYGNVGNGKTILMQYFYQILSINKLMTHYQQFMQSIHEDIHHFQDQSLSTYDIIKKIAANYAKKFSLICIDEFEITDIADAMIIGPLLLEFIRHKIFIFITSNTKPDNLYQDGLQRQSFLPIIKEIYQKFEIIHLNNNHDYRLDQVVQSSYNRIIYPINHDNKLLLNQLIADLTRDTALTPINLELFGRTISFKRATAQLLVTEFEELFLRKLSYVDYVTICQKFSIIVVENIRIIESDNTDLAIRFINFVDNAYFYKLVLFMTLETEPAKLYQNGHRSQQFKRTVSRLYEMNSYVSN